MKIAVLQHAAFESPGEIANWARLHGHTVDIHHLYLGESLPPTGAFELLVVMGGEMNIYQYRDWPWLKAESAFIERSMAEGKRVIGICLGAQLIADALGARVTQNEQHELGWFPVDWTDAARMACPQLPPHSTVLHWHGDTFRLPLGAIRLASSRACAEQGFMILKKCLGLQFHLEVDPKLVNLFVESQDNFPRGNFVQSAQTILGEAASHCDGNRRLLHDLLDTFVAT